MLINKKTLKIFLLKLLSPKLAQSHLAYLIQTQQALPSMLEFNKETYLALEIHLMAFYLTQKL